MRTRRALARPWIPGIALLLALAPGVPARAQSDKGLVPIPPFQGFVTDQAGILGEDRKAQLEAFLDQLEKKTGAEFAVLTVPTTAPEAPDEYKVRVFQAWGIGKKGQDNGVLLLVAMDEHALKFETGYGLEGTLPDGWEARMLRDLAVPRFREGQPGDGLTAAVLATAQRIAAEKNVTLEWNGRELRYDGTRRGGRSPTWIVLLVAFIVLSILSNSMRYGRRGMRGMYGAGPWIGGGWGGGFGGGGGGGSFGGFGGGGSGGGGGGASW